MDDGRTRVAPKLVCFVLHNQISPVEPLESVSFKGYNKNNRGDLPGKCGGDWSRNNGEGKGKVSEWKSFFLGGVRAQSSIPYGTVR